MSFTIGNSTISLTRSFADKCLSSLDVIERDFNSCNISFDLQLKKKDQPYLICNEQKQTETLAEVKKIPTSQNGCHIGFASWFNFDLIASRKPKVAFVCDIHSNMFLYYSLIKSAALEATNRYEFVNLLKEKLRNKENAQFLLANDFDGAYIVNCDNDSLLLSDFYDRELKRESGWLGSDESFEVVKSLYTNDKIYHLKIDLSKESEGFSNIIAWVDRNEYVIDTIYVSNIYDWISGMNEKEAYKNNISSLLSNGNNNTVVIDSIKVRKSDDISRKSKLDSNVLFLRVSIGKINDLKEETYPIKKMQNLTDNENTSKNVIIKRNLMSLFEAL